MTGTPTLCIRRGLRLLDRGDGEVQLGAHAPDAVVISDLSPADIVVLRALDGSHRRSELLRTYQSRGEDPARLDDLLGLLAEHRLLASSPTEVRDTVLGRDTPSTLPVLVAGHGPLARAIADVLSTQHHRVHRQDAIAPVELPAPPATWDLGAGRPAALAVLVADGAIDPLVARQWGPWAMVLPVVAVDGVVTVGPLWADLRDPCPMCLDHYRTDRDAAWPRLLAQLTTHRPDGTARPATAPPASTTLAAGLVATHALDASGPRRIPSGLASEVDGNGIDPVHRLWDIHPRCVTHLPAREALAG